MNISASSMRDRNIYFIIPDLNKGGGERVTCEIIKALAIKGHTVTVYTKCIEPLGNIANNVNFVEIQWANRLATVVTLFRLLLISPRNSLIIPVLTGPIILTGILNIIFRQKVIAYEHSDVEALYFNVSKWKQLIRKLLVWFALQGVHKFVVVSKYIKNRINRIFHCNENKVVVATNPFKGFLKKINAAQISYEPSANKLITAYIIGRFSQEKRITEAVEFVARSSEVDRIIVVTDVSLVLTNQLSNNAYTKTKVVKSYDEILDFNVATSFLINFSRVESFSLVIAEWLASELLVFTVSTPNLFELWSSYNGCFFIDENTPLAKHDIQNAFDQKRKLEKKILKDVTIEQTINDLFGRCGHEN